MLGGNEFLSGGVGNWEEHGGKRREGIKVVLSTIIMAKV